MAKNKKPKSNLGKSAKSSFEWLLLVLMFIHYFLEIIRKG